MDQPPLQHPARVLLFGGGPYLERGVKQLVCRLEDHPGIEFLGAFCQSKARTTLEIMRDLWRRRKWLALPLLAAQVASASSRFLAHPTGETRLRRRMQRLANRIHYVADIHAPHVLEQVRALKPDLGLIYGSPLLKPILFELPALGTLGIHHGRLPDYRGKKSTFWAMYYGEPTATVTIQKVNAELDRGQILKEAEVPIGRRSYGRVWRQLEQRGVDLYLEAILDVANGAASEVRRRAREGHLYRDPRMRDILAFYWRRWTRRRRPDAPHREQA